MEDRTLDVNVVSARGLEDVNYISKLKVYVEVSLTGDITSEQKSTTTVDEGGHRDPNWNSMMNFTIKETASRLYRQHLVFSLRTKRTLGERHVGEVKVPVNELLVSADDRLMKYVTYQVKNPSGTPCGVLNFSYKFNDRNGGHFVQPPAAAAYGGPHHNFHPHVYPPPPQPDIQFPPPPSSAPYGVYQPPFNDRNGGHFVQPPAAAAYYGPHHNFHPHVYPPPPQPYIQFPPPPSSAPYGVYQPPFTSYGYPPQGLY